MYIVQGRDLSTGPGESDVEDLTEEEAPTAREAVSGVKQSKGNLKRNVKNRDKETEDADENSDAELQQIMKEWNSPIYAFFSSMPDIEYCLGKGCVHKIRCFLDMGNKASTGNLRKHVRSCWGSDVMSTISDAKDL
ncbi:hypothetical protein V8E55_008610 [Tylopilus felleus]